MTLRQIILKLFYPLLMWSSKLKKNSSISLSNKQKIKPTVSFYELCATTNNGKIFHFNQLKGKKVIIVNTASNCGYTAQYAELEELHKQLKDKIVVIAFPANDFKNQEQSDDNAIAEFCKVNYGITFPLMRKCQVVKGKQQNEVFNWLSDATKNGWCNQQPIWNFCKYVINEEGTLTHFYSNIVSITEEQLV